MGLCYSSKISPIEKPENISHSQSQSQSHSYSQSQSKSSIQYISTPIQKFKTLKDSPTPQNIIKYVKINDVKDSNFSPTLKIKPKPEDRLQQLRLKMKSSRTLIKKLQLVPENLIEIFDRQSDTILLTDSNGIIIYANGSLYEHTMISPENILNHKIVEFLSEEYHDMCQSFYQHPYEQEVKFRAKFKHNKRKGKLIWVDIHFIRYMNENHTNNTNNNNNPTTTTTRYIQIFLKVVQIEMYLGQLLDDMRRENQHLRHDIIYKIFPPYIYKYVERGETDFLLNHNDIIIGAFDIVSFTEHINNASFTILRPLYFEADRLCELHNIFLVEIIGDAMIVAGNCTPERRNCVEDVIDFMLDFIRFTQQTTQLDVRCGIAMGRAISGMIGYNQFRYHVFGTAVNTAARMESLAKKNTIRITENVKQAINHQHNNNNTNKNYQIVPETPCHIKGLGTMTTFTIKHHPDEITIHGGREFHKKHPSLKRSSSTSTIESIESPTNKKLIEYTHNKLSSLLY